MVHALERRWTMQINVVEYLERGALAAYPHKTAIIDGANRYTFSDIERYAKRCASLLIKRSPRTSVPIAVYLPKSAATVFADLGIIYSGNVYSNLDVKSPAQRVKNILGNLEPALVITSQALLASVVALGVAPDDVLLVNQIFDDADYNRLCGDHRAARAMIDTDPLLSFTHRLHGRSQGRRDASPRHD